MFASASNRQRMMVEVDVLDCLTVSARSYLLFFFHPNCPARRNKLGVTM
ncbi:aminotransferase class I/II-fold pyridoxal phosphate-dependent enzyme [Pseudomonas sp. S37]|nr:aminotransferase class I/II-fold pyridoxal phosphate-dependent enzyme [Pseudomonas sp. S36]MBK4991969.1 aminotransferase class I/II-fold pyridoxal phosphate-dependent enzyme [Pseudomonas sp. S37]